LSLARPEVDVKMVRVLVAALAMALAASQTAHADADDLRPVHPGEPGVRPSWNQHALRFIYPPAFDAPKVDGAKSYRFTLHDGAGRDHTFTADHPWAALSPVWQDVPEGYTTLSTQALGADGHGAGKPYERIFYRSPGFSGDAGQPAAPYADAGRRALKAIFDAPHVQHWLQTGRPDRGYARYCYPNKVIGGLLRAMCAYASSAEQPADRAAAEKIARATADYLLSIRLPESSPYAHVPPTYALNVDKPTPVTPRRVQDHWLLVPSVVDAALGFLDLYDLTRDAKYLDAATAVADACARTQEADGTWPLMVDDRTGKPVAPQRLIPTWIISFFDRLDRRYGQSQYRAARRRAWNWIVENPLKTYQWDAQFEDIKLRPPYVNLAREQACDVAVLLMSDPDRTPGQLAQAEELLCFAEDQFTVWAPVKDPQGWKQAMPRRRKNVEVWITPCVLEQYACYDPVARSSAILINAYLKAHEVTHKPVYLAKARALANGMLAGQAWLADAYDGHGEIPTWNMKRKPINWLNNSFYAAQAIQALAAYPPIKAEAAP
jgi:maltose/maltodextrin transport system substrate-binding protein